MLQKIVDEMRAGAGTPEAWREGIPHKVEGGKGTIMIGADSAAEEKSVARGLIIDPGGEIIKVHTAEIEQDPGGEIIKVHTAEIEQARGGKIQDPGGGGNIDLGGSQTEFAKWVDPLVNNEVPRKGYEVQENKDHRSVKEDEGDARLPAEKAKDAEAEKANQMANEQETRKEEAKKFVKERAKNEAIYEVICGG